jgi:hypothetical protein
MKKGKDTNLLTSYNTMIEDNHLSIAPRNILIALKKKITKYLVQENGAPVQGREDLRVQRDLH